MRTIIKRKPRTKKTPTVRSRSDIRKKTINFTKHSRKLKKKKRVSKKRRVKAWLWMFVIMIVAFVVALPTWRALEVYSKVVINEDGGSVGILDTINEGIKVLKDDPLKGEEEDRINILALGLRGEDDPHGGLLADSIMVISFKPSTEQTAMVSIPRDLYVKIPDYNNYIHKINSVHYIGEKEDDSSGIEFMQRTVASVLDLPIHYVVRIDMQAFKDVVTVLEGIDVYLEKPFKENTQFGSYKFQLPAGENHLDAEEAFYYVQARFSTSDFDRARRQQEVLIAMKEKAKSLGIFTSPAKINQMISVIEDHVRTDMQPWEMNKMIKIAKDLNLDETNRLVFDNAPGGYLYSTYVGEAYALRPMGNDFSKMQEAAASIFDADEDEITADQ